MPELKAGFWALHRRGVGEVASMAAAEFLGRTTAPLMLLLGTHVDNFDIVRIEKSFPSVSSMSLHSGA
eukprot:1161269-Pelagomonas_calceolata.AAC.8